MSSDWIADGEKYALVGLDVKTDGAIPRGEIGPGLWVLSDNRFEFPAEWREWLGTIRAEDIEGCNLFLMSKLRSKQPDVLDAENQELRHRVELFYVGLLLARMFATAEKPVVMTGSRRNGEIGIRQIADFERPVPRECHPYPALDADDLETGARLGLKILQIEQTPVEGRRWRFFRVLHLYQETRTNPDLLERVHQYARCIDGLILSAAGKGKEQSKSRTELFIGTGHAQQMADIYDVRSAVEHLRVNRYLDVFDREVRLGLLRMEAIAEHVARNALVRIIEDPKLWAHFANSDTMEKFWALSPEERRGLWGDPIDPLDAMEGYEPRYISDGMLGKA